MNWLAHVHLSPPDVEFQLGNLLADTLRREPRGVMGPVFEAGRRCHAAIDRFTDTHPIVHRSKMRIAPGNRRYAGILVDMFYDHYLAKNWEQFHETTLRDFTRRFYEEATARRHQLPEDGADLIEYLVREDRLYSYLKLEGIESALQRMSHRMTLRWKKSVRMQDAVPALRLAGDEMEKDFLEFFPQLVSHLASGEWLNAKKSDVM
ncbi:MAG TPA: acyl carrier protein phosphodiesterase [Candidatus Saccharimonadia bacterium]|nr:acyl carrier protein phosphodiesterase [Candidatus Saccharimonadia bacterium]